MPRRRTVKIKYRVQVTRRISMQSRLQPAEYAYLAAGQMEAIRCEACGATLQRLKGDHTSGQTCPSCGQDIDSAA